MASARHSEEPVLDNGAPPAPPKVPVFSRKDVVYTAIVSFVAWTFASFDAQIFGTLLPVIRESFHWSTAQASLVASWVTFGAVLVGITVGPIIDYLGRKKALFITTGGAAVSSGLAALAAGPLSLVAIRSLSGFGQSEQAVNSAYLNELLPAKRRGTLYGLIQAGYPAGVLLASLAALAGTSGDRWRSVFVIATAPLLVMFVLRIWMKESPAFVHTQYVRRLGKAGYKDAARRYGREHGIDVDRDRRFSYLQLFDSDLRRHTIWVCCGFFMHFFGSQQLTVLSTTILRDGKGIDTTDVLWIVVIGNLLALCGFVFFGWLGDRIGRRETIILCYVVAGFAYAYLTLWAQGYWPVVIGYAIGLLFDQGAAAPLFAYLGESYPTRARGSGVTLVATIGPVGGIVGGFTYAALQFVGLNASQAAATGAASSVIAGLCFLGARKIRPGRKLDEITI
jgi:MFS family permease